MAKKVKKAAAKKAPAKKTKPVKAKASKPSKGRWTAPGAKDRATAAKKATKAETQVPLIKGLRIRSLDNVCGHISDNRAAIARLQGEEADLERQAHDLLKKHDKQSWQHAGVILVRVPGEEKLTVKTVRSRGPAPAAQPEEQETPENPDAEAARELGDVNRGADEGPEDVKDLGGADDQVH